MDAIAPQVARFDVGTVIDGYEVIDTIDGRPVTTAFSNEASALAAKTSLNDSVLNGPKAFRRALGAIEDDDLDLE
jgi:hypothetical protein